MQSMQIRTFYFSQKASYFLLCLLHMSFEDYLAMRARFLGRRAIDYIKVEEWHSGHYTLFAFCSR